MTKIIGFGVNILFTYIKKNANKLLMIKSCIFFLQFLTNLTAEFLCNLFTMFSRFINLLHNFFCVSIFIKRLISSIKLKYYLHFIHQLKGPMQK